MPGSFYPPAAPASSESRRLLKAVGACAHLAMTWRGEAYRAATVARANEADLLSGEGSRLWGQRWNPPGLFRTVYLSLEMSTAVEESLAQNRRYGLPDSKGSRS